MESSARFAAASLLNLLDRSTIVISLDRCDVRQDNADEPESRSISSMMDRCDVRKEYKADEPDSRSILSMDFV